jgi:streptogramin lyase
MLGADRSTLLLTAAGDPTAPIRQVPLGAPAKGLSAGRAGEVLVPAGARVFRVNLADGATQEVATGGDAVSATWAPDDSLAVGTSNGEVRLIDPVSGSTTVIDGLVSADALAVTGDSLVALDRRQTSVTEIDLADDRLGLALRAGDGATNIDGDDLGRLVVTDTTDGGLLAFTAEPLVLHQRFPVGSSPYAVAVDDQSGIVWLTATATNEVVGYDLSSGIPEETARYATVRQPNSLAVDERTGDLLVGSAAGDGLQTIPASSPQGGR